MQVAQSSNMNSSLELRVIYAACRGSCGFNIFFPISGSCIVLIPDCVTSIIKYIAVRQQLERLSLRAPYRMTTPECMCVSLMRAVSTHGMRLSFVIILMQFSQP